MLFALRAFILLGVFVAATGCRMIEPQPKGRSPLQPLDGSAQGITLEIFSAPVAVGDPQLAKLWAEVDEQPLSVELRRRLSQNGMRAGVVGPGVPGPLGELLKLTDERISTEERSQVPLDAEPGPQLRVLQPRPGKRNDLVVSSTYEQISLLRSFEGQVDGKTYRKAEGRLQLRVFPEPDGRVRLELQPELHHGELKTHITGSEGMLIWKPERAKQLFADLKLVLTLSAGQMLLMTCQDNKPGSIGHYFFTQQDGEKPMQKLWVIRLAQAGADRSFLDLPATDARDISSDDLD